MPSPHDLTIADVLRRTLDRRSLLRAGAGLMLAACGAGLAGTESSDQGTGAGGSCSQIPEETEGPYPGDGSNGPNVLATSGIVRSDITTSFGGLSGTATGIPIAVTLNVVDKSSCAPLKDYAVYLWHCDAAGRYSLYSSGVTNQNYLRGVQVTDADGNVSFKTIFPACYDGRWPHMHFEVFPSLAAASSHDGKIATSQLALPSDTCKLVYATSGYEASVSNFSKVSLATDGIFRDGYGNQLPEISGDVTAGFAASLMLGV